MIDQFRTLIDQLQYAVDRAQGKTTITQADISLMSSVYRELKRYDDMASKSFRKGSNDNG